jgi:hypothetical protein
VCGGGGGRHEINMYGMVFRKAKHKIMQREIRKMSLFTSLAPSLPPSPPRTQIPKKGEATTASLMPLSQKISQHKLREREADRGRRQQHARVGGVSPDENEVPPPLPPLALLLPSSAFSHPLSRPYPCLFSLLNPSLPLTSSPFPPSLPPATLLGRARDCALSDRGGSLGGTRSARRRGGSHGCGTKGGREGGREGGKEGGR